MTWWIERYEILRLLIMELFIPQMSLPIYTTPSSALGILLFKISSNFVRGIVSHCTFTWELFPVGCSYAGYLKFSYLAFTFAWTIIPTGYGLWYLSVDGHDPLPLSQGKFLDALTLWPWNFLAPCYEKKIQASGRKWYWPGTTEALSQQDISWPQVCLEPGGWEGILGFTCEPYFRGCNVHANMASPTKTGRKSKVSRLANIFNLKLDIGHVSAIY